MTPKRWRQIEELYHAAREDRAVLDSADPELRREVEFMLAQSSGGELLNQPAAHVLDESTATQLAAGAQLGPYTIEALIGSGGMGVVYRAVDTRLGRKVAVKVCSDRFSERFHREAQAISALNHPHICTLYDVGSNFLVMELLEGGTLSARLKLGRLPLEETLRYGAQIAAALAEAHSKGIVHRDLKPGNIMLTKNGAKVLDFGLARSAQDAVLTASDMVIGTPAYMAPEQLEGRYGNMRSDIYALGLTLYEAATGKHPPHGPLPPEGLPASFLHIIERCLVADPEGRWQAASDVKSELEWIATSQSAASISKTPQRMLATSMSENGEQKPQATGLRHLLWVGAAALAGGMLVWGWLHIQPGATHPVTRWTTTLPASGDNVGSGIAISRDGTRLAYVGQTGGSSRIWVRVLDQPAGKPIPGTQGGLRPFFSPDGQWLAYFQDVVGPLKKVPVTGGPPITLCDNAFFAGGSWGEDGSIVFTGSSGLMRVSGSGGTCQVLTRADPQKREAHRFPQILPDGQSILFTSGTEGSFDSARIAVLDLKSGAIRFLMNRGSTARYVSSGHVVYLRGGTMFAVPFDAKRLVVAGPETPVIDGVYYNATGGFADYAFSDSGLLVYMAETRTYADRTLEWLDRKGLAQVLPAPNQRYLGVRLSPDGQRAAVVIGSRGGGADIWIYDLARGTFDRMTSQTSEGTALSPVWTPDSRRVAFATLLEPGIYWAPVDGSRKPELLLPNQTVVQPDSWTPDGKILLYDSGPSGHIWTLSASGGGGESKPRPFLETSFNEVDAQVSPDGRWVAYTSDETRKNQVYVRPFPGLGGRTSISIEGGQEPRWSRDGRELFFRDPSKTRLMAVDIQTNPAFRAGSPRPLFELHTGNWDAAPDGKHFLVVKEPQAPAREARMEAVVNWFEELREKAPRK